MGLSDLFKDKMVELKQGEICVDCLILTDLVKNLREFITERCRPSLTDTWSMEDEDKWESDAKEMGCFQDE